MNNDFVIICKAIEYEKQRTNEMIKRCNDLFPAKNKFLGYKEGAIFRTKKK